jgi:hypothetical protein
MLCFACCTVSRLLRALQESKKAVAKLTKEKHSAEVAAAELRGKAEAERDTQRIEVQMAQQQLEAARAQVARLEGDIKDYKARAQVGWCVWWCSVRGSNGSHYLPSRHKARMLCSARSGLM